MEENKDMQQKPTQVLNIGIPTVYFNGFGVSINPGDSVITLMLNGRPVLVLNASHTTTKTLSQEINKSIELLESKAEFNIKTITEIFAKLNNKVS